MVGWNGEMEIKNEAEVEEEEKKSYKFMSAVSKCCI